MKVANYFSSKWHPGATKNNLTQLEVCEEYTENVFLIKKNDFLQS